MQSFITSSAGVRIPGIIYGTAWKKADTRRLVSLAIEHGFRGIDTACQPKHYDEAGVGAAVTASLNRALVRGDFYLQTKFTALSGQDPKRLPYDPRASLPAQVAQSVATSLRNLQTDYLDCLRVPHQACRHSKLVQCRDRLRSRDTGTAQHQILYQSFWTLTANPRVLDSPTIARLASTHQRTAAQILFRYLTQAGVLPLTGTKSEIHMRQNLAIFELELTAAQLREIDRLFRGQSSVR